MNSTKSRAGWLALMLAAAAAVAAWQGWKRLTAADGSAIGAGEIGPSPAIGAPFAGTAPPAPTITTPAGAAPDPAGGEGAPAIAEDEESALQSAATPETAAELADLLPEPDLPTADVDNERARTTDKPVTDDAEQMATGTTSAADDAGVDQVLKVMAADAAQREQSTIQSRFGPNAIAADAGGDCPPDHPVKGNTNSMIYHLPGQSSYGATMAEVCFADGDAAHEAGFRPRKR